ncbi:MAG: ATP-binding protein, partial [Prosthecobacter sp.]|nr:ATP-binding protein [Prosthecobacter sp.]
VVGTMRDITEGKQTEERLREQATLLDKAQDAIVVRDLEHHVLFWNKSAERLYGWTAQEALGRSIQELLYQEPAPFLTATSAVIEKGEWVGEIQQYNRDGKTLTIEGRWTLVRDDKGQPRSILAINTDITARNKLQQQFLRAQRMESIGTLAGGIAHDLNNVLAPILMSIELLRLQEKDPRRQDILSTVEGSAKRGADMVRQVLSFARGVEGRQVEVQIGHLLREIEKIANETFLKTIRVKCSIQQGLWTVNGDPTQLHQVLLNLCVNARDAMPQGGVLSLAASNLMLDEQYAVMHIDAKPGPHVVIQVEDTGSGMPPEIVERIFEPFFTTKETGKGTGLGLSTTLAIANSHGGFVQVQSEPGLGTQFRVFLPARTTTGITESSAATESELPLGNGELVLVIDDEESVRQITRQTLEMFGYRVLMAADGTEAAGTYATHKDEIAAVLTDMMMPVMDGQATIQVLRRMNPKVRIIAASGLNTSGMAAKATQAGVKHFIPKPYTAEILLKTLHQMLHESA